MLPIWVGYIRYTGREKRFSSFLNKIARIYLLPEDGDFFPSIQAVIVLLAAPLGEAPFSLVLITFILSPKARLYISSRFSDSLFRFSKWKLIFSISLALCFTSSSRSAILRRSSSRGSRLSNCACCLEQISCSLNSNTWRWLSIGICTAQLADRIFTYLQVLEALM